MNIFQNTWNVLNEKERKQFLILIFLDIIISVMDILALALLLAIIQFYVQPGDSPVLSFLPGWLVSRNSINGIAVFFLLFSAKNILAIYIARREFSFNGNVAVRISAINLSYYQQSSFSEYIEVDSSVHLRKIGFQPFEFCQYLLSGLQQLITQSFLIFITIAAILLFNAKLFFLLLLILLPPIAIVFYLVKKKLHAARSGIRESNERSFQYLLDALKGYVEANVYNRNGFFMRRFIKYRKKFSDHLFDSLGIQAIPGRVIEVFAVMGLFILILLAQWSGNDKKALLTIGAFMAAAYKIIPGMVKLINVSGQMKAYESSLLDLVKNSQNLSLESRKIITPVKSIHFRNLDFLYGDRPILQAFNCSIQEGDFVGITGRSGRGKTTVFNLLLGFLQPAGGDILINDIPVNKDDLKDQWPAIAYIRQQSFLINDTVLKNITMEDDGIDTDRAQRALRISGLEDMLARFPGGSEWVISENGKNISGGQQQRIAIARGLYKDANIFLLDEPFNELDEQSEIALLEHFRQLAREGKIVIMITHDHRSLSYCNKIVSLDN